MGVQRQPAVAGHGLGHIDQERVGNRVARVAQQRVHHELGVVTRGPCVPQAQRRDAVGVDVLGGALQLSERRDGVAALLTLCVVDLQEERLVTLHDQRPVGHDAVPSCRTAAYSAPVMRDTV